MDDPWSDRRLTKLADTTAVTAALVDKKLYTHFKKTAIWWNADGGKLAVVTSWLWRWFLKRLWLNWVHGDDDLWRGQWIPSICFHIHAISIEKLKEASSIFGTPKYIPHFFNTSTSPSPGQVVECLSVGHCIQYLRIVENLLPSLILLDAMASGCYKRWTSTQVNFDLDLWHPNYTLRSWCQASMAWISWPLTWNSSRKVIKGLSKLCSIAQLLRRWVKSWKKQHKNKLIFDFWLARFRVFLLGSQWS